MHSRIGQRAFHAEVAFRVRNPRSCALSTRNGPASGLKAKAEILGPPRQPSVPQRHANRSSPVAPHPLLALVVRPLTTEPRAHPRLLDTPWPVSRLPRARCALRSEFIMQFNAGQLADPSRARIGTLGSRNQTTPRIQVEQQN